MKGTNQCRICHKSSGGRLIAPCGCKGTISMAHEHCVKDWLLRTGTVQCAVCQHKFVVTRIFSAEAPSLSSQSNNDSCVAAVQVILRHCLRRLVAVGAHFSFFVAVWLVAVPLFLSGVWHLQFNLEGVVELQLLQKDFAVSRMETWWLTLYLPGLCVAVGSMILLVVGVTWMGYCQENIALFELHSGVLPSLEDPVEIDDQSPSPTDTEDEMEQDTSSAGASAVMRSASPADEDSARVFTPRTDRRTEAPSHHQAEQTADPPVATASGGIARTQLKRQAAGYSVNAAEVVSEHDAATVFSTILEHQQTSGDKLRVTDHFGLTGSCAQAFVLAVFFTAFFAPLTLFLLVRLPLWTGAVAGRWLIQTVDWALESYGSFAPVSFWTAILVLSPAVSGVPLSELFPLSIGTQDEGQPHPLSSGHNGLIIARWCFGVLLVSGVVRRLSEFFFRKQPFHKSVVFVCTLVKGVVANGLNIAVMPAVYALVLCFAIGPYWVPDAASAHLAGDALRPFTVPMSWADVSEPTSAGATVVLHALTAFKEHPNQTLFHLPNWGRADSWPSLTAQRAARILVCVDETSSYKDGDLCWSRRTARVVYTVSQVLSKVPLFSSWSVWLPLYLCGLAASAAQWNCWFHIRRLTSPKVLCWLFRDPVDTPLVEQLVKCRHRMVLIYGLRNALLMCVPYWTVVRPALWLLFSMFPSCAPLVLSWSSGEPVVDALCGNLLLFGGRIARFLALVGGQPLEEEVLFRRIGAIADGLRDLHDAFFDRVGSDLGVSDFLKTAVAPKSSADLLFPLRVAAFVALYCALSAVVVFALLLPGVATSSMFYAVLSGGPALSSSLTLPALRRQFTGEHVSFHAPVSNRNAEALPGEPLTVHALVIGWCLALLVFQLYELFAPKLMHVYVTLRWKLSHRQLQMWWLKVILQSATAGVLEASPRGLLVGRGREDTQHVAAMSLHAAVFPPPWARRGGGHSPAEWLVQKRTVLKRIATALQHVQSAAQDDQSLAVVQVLNTLQTYIQHSRTGLPALQLPSLPPLKFEGAALLAGALMQADGWRAQVSALLFCIGLGTTALLGPLSLGAGLIHLFCSGSLRSSTQALHCCTDLQLCVRYAFVAWSAGTVFLVAVSKMWCRSFPLLSGYVADVLRCGLTNCSDITCVWRMLKLLVPAALWMSAGFVCLPTTAHALLRLIAGHATEFASVSALVRGPRDVPDVEVFLVHLGMVEWLVFAGWVLVIALVSEHSLPFLPPMQPWRMESVEQTADELVAREQDAAGFSHPAKFALSKPSLPQLPKLSAEDEEIAGGVVAAPQVRKDPTGPTEAGAAEIAAIARTSPNQGLRSKLKALAARIEQQDYDQSYLVDIWVHDKGVKVS